MASLRPLGELGWQGKFKFDSADVTELREQLRAEGGIKGSTSL